MREDEGSEQGMEGEMVVVGGGGWGGRRRRLGEVHRKATFIHVHGMLALM